MSGLYRRVVRNKTLLTTSWVTESEVIDLAGLVGTNQLILYIDYTRGVSTGMDMKIEFSADNSDWYTELETTSTQEAIIHKSKSRRFTEDIKGRIAIPVSDPYVRISVVAIGTAAGSSVGIIAVAGNI